MRRARRLIDGQLGEPEYPEPTQVVRIGKRDFECRSTPYDGGTLVSVDGGEAIDVDRRLGAGAAAAGRPTWTGASAWSRWRAKGRDWLLTTRGARAQRAGACRAMSPSCRGT